MKHPALTFIPVMTALSLAACGGGNGDVNPIPDGGSGDSASFSLGLTDGPVDTAQEVVIQFTGVELRSGDEDEFLSDDEDGNPIRFDFDEPRSIDLLTLQGNASEPLIENETIPAGEYSQLRLLVNAEQDSVFDSYIILGDGTQHEIWIPSGAQNGLRLVSGFTAAEGSTLDFTVDFDLRKSITNPPGQEGVIMRPTLRLINNLEAGSISGTIDNQLVQDACENVTENDGAVYVYSGEVDTATDTNGSDSDPLTTALVSEAAGVYSYEVGFLAEGDYSVAYTCQNDQDVADTVEDLAFFDLTTVSVTADEDTDHDITAAEAELVAN